MSARTEWAVRAPSSLALTVTEAKTAAENVLALTLRCADGQPLPEWQPGAHIDVHLGNGLTRQYSLCGDPDNLDEWQIAVLKDAAGRGGSLYVHDTLRTRSRLCVSGPRNNFSLVDADDYLFIAGGIGITPILPMMEAVSASGRPWRLIYGGRSRRSMAFLDRLEVRPPGSVFIVPQDECGLIDIEAVMGSVTPGTAVFCCGPPPLIDAVADGCSRARPQGFYRELFAAPAPAGDESGCDFEVYLARSDCTITVGERVGLLDALESAGFKVTNSCRAGICGTCLLGVLGGVPDHQDHLLSDEQRDEGRVILPCVSRSKTKRLVLDL